MKRPPITSAMETTPLLYQAKKKKGITVHISKELRTRGAISLGFAKSAGVRKQRYLPLSPFKKEKNELRNKRKKRTKMKLDTPSNPIFVISTP